MTIQRTNRRSNIRCDTFYQRRNNSTSDMTIRYAIQLAWDNSMCDAVYSNIQSDNSTCYFRIQHACGKWVLDDLCRLRKGTGPTAQSTFRAFKKLSRRFPSPFSLSIPSNISPVFVFFMSNQENDASSTLRRVAEQLLTLANTGKFHSLFGRNLSRFYSSHVFEVFTPSKNGGWPCIT